MKKKKGNETCIAEVHEDDEFVTLLMVDNEKEFEDGELELDETSIDQGLAMNREHDSTPTNVNSSATVVENRKFAPREDRSRMETDKSEEYHNRSKSDEEDLTEVTKKIAGETFALVKDTMEKSGIMNVADMVKDQLEQINKTKDCKRISNAAQKGEMETASVTKVYENAVEDQTQARVNVNDMFGNSKRISSSSEDGEGLDTSDESNFGLISQVNQINLHNLINSGDQSGGRLDDQVPSTSGQRRLIKGTDGNCEKRMVKSMVVLDDKQHKLTPEEKADKMFREAEAAKARLFATPGKDNELNKQFHSVMVDEDYLLVASHVDNATLNKIIAGEYVDFARLIPRDRVLQEEDQHLEMIVHGGKTYWVPAGDCDVQSIHNFGRWEQAFRVYSDIYLRSHPSRSTELIQYNHIIHMTSLTYTWENVYSYDKDFRIHISQHPECSWGIILQQAWAMRLKDKISRFEGQKQDYYGRRHSSSPSQASTSNSESVDINTICRHYNRGRCSFGHTCRYEHHCLYCFKFGHSISNCRKLAADKSQKRDGRYNRYDQDRCSDHYRCDHDFRSKDDECRKEHDKKK